MMNYKSLLIAMLACCSSQFALATTEAELSSALQVPTGFQVAFELSASGVQIYECQKSPASSTTNWQFSAPRASLSNLQGQLVGKHYAGPVWEDLDGSIVVGKVVAKQDSPDPTAIPWLLLQANQHQGAGKFAEIHYIQRLATAGGKAPTGNCTPGEKAEVPYTAQYRFYKSV